MSSESDYSLISFVSSHHAIRAEGVATPCVKGEKPRLIPTPPEVSAGCGLVLKLPICAVEEVIKAFRCERIEFESVFFVKCEGNTKTDQQKSL